MFNSMDVNSDSAEFSEVYPSKSYALSGKIMLTAIVILLFVVFFLVCLHFYARWYLLRARRRHGSRRRSRLVFHLDPSAATAASHGLDAAVLNSLPVFVYSSETHPEQPECAVCLSEFEENETGRLLPKCKHSFHTECIDMWFHTHSNCPLCRSPVEPGPEPENPAQIAVSVNEPERAESDDTELCSTCQHEGSSSSSPFRALRKRMELVVPRRNASFGNESGIGSPASRTPSYTSPMGRMLSFRRIMGRDRKVGASPSGTGAEMDIERGREEMESTSSEFTRKE